MPCFYGDDIDANDGGNINLGLAQVFGVRPCQDIDDIYSGDDIGGNLGLAQVVGIRSRQDGDGHCDGTEVVEETKNKPDPEGENLLLMSDDTITTYKRTGQQDFSPSQDDAPMRVCDHDDESRGDAKHQ